MRHVESYVRHMQEVVGEVFLDHVALVAATDHEVIHAMGGIQLHDVPENRFATDLDHGLGFEMCLFRDSGAEATSKNNGNH